MSEESGRTLVGGKLRGDIEQIDGVWTAVCDT